MTSIERLRRRLTGEPVDRIPNFNIFMGRAAHHINETLRGYYLDHRVLCRANFAVLEDFELDIVQAISDPYRETADFGADIIFPDDGLPVCRAPLIVEEGDLMRLSPLQPEKGARMSDRIEAVRLFREKAGGEVPIMGWVEGAMAEAADLRGVNQLLLDLYDRPEWLEELLELCVETEIAFARVQVAAGADIIGLGDAIASQVGPERYRRFALPYEKRIFDEVKGAGALARLHICGDTTALLEDMVGSGADIIDIDWMVDIGSAAKVFNGRTALCGNQDPAAVMLAGTPEIVRRAVRTCAEKGGPFFISAAGCEIPDGTPAVNLRAQSEVLRELADS